MLNFIKTVIASHYYKSALHLVGISSPGLAIETLKKAARIEPNEKYVPRYLSLQGELEWGIGYKEKALNTLKTAKGITDRYPDYWNAEEHKEIKSRIKAAIVEIESTTT